MFRRASLIAFTLAAVALGQQVGTNTAEVHPSLPAQKCTKSGGCVTQSTKIVLDANWRWLHSTAGYTNCFTGSTWDASLCPDPVTCVKNCALEGADYSSTYGINASGNAVTLKFVTGTNVGSRVYLMENDSTYQLFKLKNQEFTFDVDMSNLPCGLNGALYLTEMAADGGLSKYPNNKAGAKYGTGYCDAQCPHDIKYINGEANTLGWADSGKGQYGTCCSEMDIWEANSMASAYTPHPCNTVGQTRCDSTNCGDGDGRYTGLCDKDGCDFNSYRQGDTTFLGPGKTIDTTKKITVVTQFLTSDNTASGALSEIRRIYVQNGKVIQNSQSTYASVPGNSVTDTYCDAQKTLFGDNNQFKTNGGLKAMGDSLQRGMVLSMSLWDDHEANALWLDSSYPTTGDPSTPGIARGPCATTSGKPEDVEKNIPNSSVTFSNIRWGDIGSTFSNPNGGGASSSSTTTGGGATTSKPTTTTTPKPTTVKTSTAAPSPTSVAAHYGQCGGKGWTGPTVCASPYTCKASGEYYSQCL